MTHKETPDAGAATARSRIETLVGAYPNLTDDELRELLHWHRRTASSYEVAMLSARDDISAGYAQFKKDHIERISPIALAIISMVMIFLIGLVFVYAR